MAGASEFRLTDEQVKEIRRKYPAPAIGGRATFEPATLIESVPAREYRVSEEQVKEVRRLYPNPPQLKVKRQRIPCPKHPDAPKPAGTGNASRYKCVECWRESKRKQHRKLQGYDEWWNRQNGLCALCREPMYYEDITSCLDHDHKNGRKRGLVHSRCNQIIAGFENMIDEIGIDQALRYLRS